VLGDEVLVPALREREGKQGALDALGWRRKRVEQSSDHRLAKAKKGDETCWREW